MRSLGFNQNFQKFISEFKTISHFIYDNDITGLVPNYLTFPNDPKEFFSNN